MCVVGRPQQQRRISLHQGYRAMSASLPPNPGEIEVAYLLPTPGTSKPHTPTLPIRSTMPVASASWRRSTASRDAKWSPARSKRLRWSYSAVPWMPTEKQAPRGFPRSGSAGFFPFLIAHRPALARGRDRTLGRYSFHGTVMRRKNLPYYRCIGSAGVSNLPFTGGGRFRSTSRHRLEGQCHPSGDRADHVRCRRPGLDMESAPAAFVSLPPPD